MSAIRSRRPERLGAGDITAIQRELLDRSPPEGMIAFVATDEDVPEMMALSRDAFGSTSLTRRDLVFYLHRAHALAFGLKRAGAIVAYCVIELNAGQYRVYVVETCTARVLQRQGLGSWLRARVADIALYLGYRHITTHVAVTNTAALRMNEKAGLTVVRRVERYYDDDRDAFYMRRTLTG